MAVNETALAGAVRRYGEGQAKASELAAGLGMSRQKFVAEARRRALPSGKAKTVRSSKAPSPKAVSPNSAGPGAPQKQPSKKSKARPEVLVQHVYDAIDGELTKLEKQEGLKSQDRERASRALSQMVSSLEKAVDMQRKMTKDKKKGASPKDLEALRHADDMRKEIAERLERMRRGRHAGAAK
jgi:hypothetical protein